MLGTMVLKKYLHEQLVMRVESLWGSAVTCGRSLVGICFQYVAEGEAGFEAGDAGEPGEFALMEAAIVVDAGDADDEHVVILAGHEVTTDDAPGFANCGFECGEDWSRLAFESDANEDGHAPAEEAVVDLGAVSADGSDGFKSLDASGGG